MTIIIEKTTAAIGQHVSYNTDRFLSDLVVCASGLSGSESVGIYFSLDDGQSWDQLKENGSAVTLTANTNARSLKGGPLYGFTKSATTNAVAVGVGR